MRDHLEFDLMGEDRSEPENSTTENKTNEVGLNQPVENEETPTDNFFTVSWTNQEGETEEGPLSLLWSLIQSYRIDIFNVSLNRITEDFLSFMQHSQELNIEHASSFTVMAARLLYYKSKTLLPDPGFEEVDPEPRLPPEIIQQLLEYRKFQMAAEKLHNIGETSAGMLSRKTKFKPVVEQSEESSGEWLDVSLVDLVQAYGKIVSRQIEEQTEHDMTITMEDYSVEEQIEKINKLLEDAVSFDFEDLFSDLKSMTRGAIIAVFLAILELCKLGTIILQQKSIFGKIVIFNRKASVS